MIACWDCRNLEAFVQVSPRGDARQVTQLSSGLKPTEWGGSDAREPGIFCARCDKPVDADLAELGLVDDRVAFVSPDEFDADAAAVELMALRPAAAWTRLDLPERLPRFADIPADLHPDLLESLRRTKRDRLFVHQAEATQAALDGGHVVQATSAGSGKSLGFTLPVLDRLLRNPEATALFVFPLRALANDQMAALERFGVVSDPWVNATSFDLRVADASTPIRVARHDGSTQDHERSEVRRAGRIIITTPDSLHAAILGNMNRSYKDGTSWRRILHGLQFVVLDELHTYQGVFGSGVGNVIRRLRRACARFDSVPQFLAASATIGNPVELAENLTGLSPFVLVDDDASHRRRRVLLVCNPPSRVADDPATKALKTKRAASGSEQESPEDPIDDLSGRIAPQTIAIDLLAKGALAGQGHPPVRSIAFCRSRNAVFQLAQRTKSMLGELHRDDLVASVAPYAATFLADDRVEAEGKLRDGSTLAITSTNALELGIDISDLSIAILVGYPGQISSFRQRIGRAGRTGEGLAVLIVGDDPLQQYLARDPDALQALLDAPPESVVVNPEAPEVVRRYGLAPAQEEADGIAFEDAEYFGEAAVHAWLADATGAPEVERKGVAYWRVPWEGEPHRAALRNAVSSKTYTVLHQTGKDFKPIGTLDEGTAPRDAFVPAIWSGPEGQLYRVTGFDQKASEIYCEGPVNVQYLTRGMSVDHVEVVSDQLEPVHLGSSVIGYGELAINRQVFSYKEQHFSGAEQSRQVERGWPPVEFVTDGMYVRIGEGLFGDHHRDDSMRALEHLFLSVAPALVACDPYDLDSASAGSSLFLYDSFGGGIGLSGAAAKRFGDLVDLAYEVVVTCPCEKGCPSCVMLSRRPDGNRSLSKDGAVAVLEAIRAMEGVRRLQSYK